MSGNELTYIALGLVLTGLIAARLVMYRQKKNKLKNAMFFLFFVACVSNLIKMSTADYQANALRYDLVAVGASLFYTVLMHFIAKWIARRKEMKPKRHESSRQAVRHDRGGATGPVRHGEASESPYREAAKTAVSPEAVEIPIVPEAPKPPVRQTLRTCLRCGHNLTGPFCGECGYQVSTDVCLLRFVDPERLQVSVRKN